MWVCLPCVPGSWLSGYELAVLSLWVPQPWPMFSFWFQRGRVMWSFWLLQGHWGHHLPSWHPSWPSRPSNDHPDYAVHSTGNETGKPAFTPPSFSFLPSVFPDAVQEVSTEQIWLPPPSHHLAAALSKSQYSGSSVFQSEGWVGQLDIAWSVRKLQLPISLLKNFKKEIVKDIN